MGIGAEALRLSIDELARREPAFAAALARSGYPEPRLSERGYTTLLRTIVGQQVSLAAARSIWAKLEAAVGSIEDPAALAAASDEALRGAGLSRQKIAYVRSLAEEVASGRLDLLRLAEADEEAIGELTRIKGIGRWSAEIYLLFAEGRPDVWPAGDLAIQVAVGRIFGLAEKPGEKQVRELAQPWSPHRGAAAIFAWHHYRTPVL
ncbi:MAG TPA: DNA-3-methyladenine glycosylase 2 family protein [Allosphingosinicella sp.]|nr:DNA-3-methyladenine glycosylase 2 family protein [Allosphingosinicella sp.]